MHSASYSTMCPVTVYMSSTQTCMSHCHLQITQTGWAPPRTPSSPSFHPPRQHMKPLTLVSHVPENDIQFTEISLLHRRRRQSGLIAGIDASRPRPPCEHIHPPPQSHFSMKQQLTPHRYSWQGLVMVECSREIEVTVANGLRDGGKGNVLTVNYMLDSHIPSEACTWDGCYISLLWLINLLTHINEMH